MLRLVLLVPTCLSAVLGAVEPVLQMTITDAQRLQARIASGPLAGTMSHPAVSRWLSDVGGRPLAAALSGAGQVRVQFESPRRLGGLPIAQATVAAIASGGVPPVATPGLHAHQAGAWSMLGWPVVAERRPDAYAVPATPATADIQLRADLQALTALLPARDREAASSIGGVWRLGELRAHVDLAAQRGSIVLPGAVLPLKPIDVQALAGLPPTADVVCAIGLSADGWKQVAEPLAQLLRLDPAMLTGDSRFGAPLDTLLTAGAGTVWAAIVGPGAERMISLPAAEGLLLAVRRGMASLHPEPGPLADAEADHLFAQAQEQPVGLPVHGGLLFVRIAHGRIWLASSGTLLEPLQAEALDQPAPDAGWGEGASIQLRWSERAAAHLAVGGTPSTAWQGMLQAVAAAGLPAGRLDARLTGEGLEIRSPVGLWFGAALLSALPVLSSDWLSQYDAVCIARREAAVREVLKRARAFATATSGHWPRDMADLRARIPDLDATYFDCTGRPDLDVPFIYVQPAAGAPDEQPVLVQHPELQGGRGSLVGYIDGRVEFRDGGLYWQEARRLASLPAVLDQGASPADWTVMPKVF